MQVAGEAIPDPVAVAAVAAELEVFDRPPSEQLSELLGDEVVPDDPAEALDTMLAEPAAPEPTPIPELTQEAFSELAPEVAQIWAGVYGADVGDRVQDAHRGLQALAADEATLDFVDSMMADFGGVRLEVGLWDALATAGKRLAWNGAVGSPIAGSRIEAFEATPVREALLEAERDGLVPPNSVAAWVNGRLQANVIGKLMNARKGIAHLARGAPEVLQAGVQAGLGNDPEVWRRLAAFGSRLSVQRAAAGAAGRSKDTSMTAASSDKAAAILAKARELQADPRYYRDRDPEIVRQVERAYKAARPGVHGDATVQHGSTGVSR
jgi:hypothetical protein